jgi:hypothetical protein
VFSLRPPKKKAIKKIVTGFVVDAEKQGRLTGRILGQFHELLTRVRQVQMFGWAAIDISFWAKAVRFGSVPGFTAVKIKSHDFLFKQISVP